MAMHQIEAAGEGIDQLLSRLEGGDELLITRGGRPVALLRSIPCDNAQTGVAGLLQVRAQLARDGVQSFSAAEIRALIDEGRKN